MACQFCGASPSGDSCAIGCYTGANTIKRESFELWLVEWGESLQAIAAKQRRAEVAGLVERVSGMINEAARHTAWGEQEADAAFDALDALARLAGGGA